MHAALTEEQRLIGDMARKFAIAELSQLPHNLIEMRIQLKTDNCF